MSLPRLQRLKGFDLLRHCANDMSHILDSITNFLPLPFLYLPNFPSLSFPFLSLYFLKIDSSYINYHEHSSIRPHMEVQPVQ